MKKAKIQNLYDFFTEIDKNLNVFNLERLNILLQKIKHSNNTSISKYLFESLHNYKWLESVQKHGLFSVATIETDKFWYPLRYLEKISANEKHNQYYAHQILDIINNIIQYSKKQHVENDHIWASCIKIISNLPRNKIASYFNTDRHSFEEWINEMTKNPYYLTTANMAKELTQNLLKDRSTYAFSEITIKRLLRLKKSNKDNFLGERRTVEFFYNKYWIHTALKGKNDYQDIAKKVPSLINYTIEQLNIALGYEYGIQTMDIGDIYRLEVRRVEQGGSTLGFKGDRFKCEIKKFSDIQIKEMNESEYSDWDKSLKSPSETVKSKEIIIKSKDAFVEKIAKFIKSCEIESIEIKKKYLSSLYVDIYGYTGVKSPDTDIKNIADIDDYSGTHVNLIVFLKKLLNKSTPGKRIEILNWLIQEEYQYCIYAKIILYFIDKYWKEDRREVDYQKLFSGLLDSQYSIFTFMCETEVYTLLKNRNKYFNKKINSLVKKQLNRLSASYKTDEKKAKWKHQWLSALKNNTEFKEEYNKTKKIAGIDYSPSEAKSECRTVSHSSPLSKEQILNMPFDQLVSYVCDFKDSGDRVINAFNDGPDCYGLALELKEAVKENPQKFIDNISELQEMPYYYIPFIVEQFHGLWSDRENIPVSEVFNFCFEYIKNNSKRIIEEEQYSTNIHLFEAVTYWIRAACERNAKSVFTADEIPVVKKLLEFICEKSPVSSEKLISESSNNIVTFSLNSTQGKNIIATIEFALLRLRIGQKEDEDCKPENWGADVYEKFFDRDDIEAYVWFGQYLRNIAYLDELYSKKKIKELESGKDIRKWQSFIEGYSYCSYNTTAFNLMSDHYEKALRSNDISDNAYQSLVKDIVIKYLRDDDELQGVISKKQDTLFKKMLCLKSDRKEYIWHTLSEFLWRISENEKESKEIYEKIISFWEWSSAQNKFIEQQAGDEYKYFLEKMLLLVGALPKIEKTHVSWIKLSLPYLEVDYNSTFFIEYLNKFEDAESICNIANIYIEMLNTNSPTHPKKDIEATIEKIYKLNDNSLKTKANNICNIYAERGFYFLQDIYNKYNK